MTRNIMLASRQRAHPRVAIEAFCTALGEAPDTHAIAVDLSPRGLRIQRPVSGRMPQKVQLELEIPGIDDLLWAVGEVRYDRLESRPTTPTRGLSGVVRSCGIQIVAAASYHRRLLREYVFDTFRALERRAEARATWLPQLR
jgi:hypothetical protein